MLKPTLVNTASPSTRVLESKKKYSEMEKVEEKIEAERQRGALVRSLHRQLKPTWPEKQRLENVRWRHVYIDRRTPRVHPYPAVSSDKVETEAIFYLYFV